MTTAQAAFTNAAEARRWKAWERWVRSHPFGYALAAVESTNS